MVPHIPPKQYHAFLIVHTHSFSLKIYGPGLRSSILYPPARNRVHP